MKNVTLLFLWQMFKLARSWALETDTRYKSTERLSLWTRAWTYRCECQREDWRRTILPCPSSAGLWFSGFSVWPWGASGPPLTLPDRIYRCDKLRATNPNWVDGLSSRWQILRSFLRPRSCCPQPQHPSNVFQSWSLQNPGHLCTRQMFQSNPESTDQTSHQSDCQRDEDTDERC